MLTLFLFIIQFWIDVPVVQCGHVCTVHMHYILASRVQSSLVRYLLCHGINLRCNFFPFPFLPLPLQTLAGFSDVENFCDMVDTLEEQGIEACMFVSGVGAGTTAKSSQF